MRAFVTRKELKDWTPLAMWCVFDYVQETGNSDLYVPCKEYIELFQSCTEKTNNHIGYTHSIKQGRTKENYPYFMIAGIKIIMLPKDKIETFTILK